MLCFNARINLFVSEVVSGLLRPNSRISVRYVVLTLGLLTALKNQHLLGERRQETVLCLGVRELRYNYR
jgi:hypothetical protein